MRLTTNLASESYHRTRFFRLFLFLLSLVLAGTGGLQIRFYLLWQDEYRQLEEDLHKAQAGLHSLEEELRALGVDVSDSGLASFRSQVDSYNGLIAEKAFSWTLLLSELEEAVPSNISVTRLQPCDDLKRPGLVFKRPDTVNHPVGGCFGVRTGFLKGSKDES